VHYFLRHRDCGGWGRMFPVLGMLLVLPHCNMAIETSPESEIPAGYNRLYRELSPYLRQHADNPVDWYPWGEEAFALARREDKPVFLSIGYATCHWCHVMEHESFEDPDVAQLMNETFVCIKVDREERPDIDNVYMQVCQMMSSNCGWPLNIIMTPDKRPFYAMTYLPKEARFGRIGMMDLIPQVKTAWLSQRDELENIAGQVTDALQEPGRDSTKTEIDARTLARAVTQLDERYDARWGGFSRAPKFPSPHNLIFLLRQWKRTGNERLREMVETTLRAMRAGGIYDHIGFGFHRYATDEQWLVPHFEKMLYDQAMLALAYLEAYQATGAEDFARTAREIFTYILRDMIAPEGAFYSAEDADSEGVEGKYYLWQVKELRRLLSTETADLLMTVFSVREEGNFTSEAPGIPERANILHQTRTLAEHAENRGITETALRAEVQRAREILLRARSKRVPPLKDDKILTDWNGLMIAALAKGGRLLEEPALTKAAETAANFILRDLRRPDGGLYHRYREGDAGITGFVDDYAFFAWGLIELYETTFETTYLRSAIELTRYMLDMFWDSDNGGFYFTPADGEKLLVRNKEFYDGAIPSGNAVAMLNLLRLGRMTANADFENKAHRITQAFSSRLSDVPSAFSQTLTAVDFGIGPGHEVIIAGRREAADTQAMLRVLRQMYLPNTVVLLRPPGGEGADIAQLAEYTSTQTAINGRATAYVCRNYQCELPTTDVEQMRKLLETENM